MRPWKKRSDSGDFIAEVDGTKRRRRKGRGWGPFTGGQLTVVIVAIAAMFAIPTAALAAGGAFSNNSSTVPAVKGTNANAHGVGVQGTGKKFGVYSNGPLGVAKGKSLSCTGCVGASALSTGARSLSDVWGAGGGNREIGEYDGLDHYTLVSSISVPAGVYLVNYDANIEGFSQGSGVCFLHSPAGDTGFDSGTLAEGVGTWETNISHTTVVQTSAGVIALECEAYYVSDPSASGDLTALKIGNSN